MTILRSKSETYCGPDEGTVDEWRKLQYKPFHKEVASYSSFTGFYSNSVGENIFIAIWEYLGEMFPDFEPNIDTDFWKLSFSLKEPRE